MNRTQIEWIVNPDGSRPGWSWNPLTGCMNNCSYCYARKLANGRLKKRYLANDNVVMRFSDGYAAIKVKVTDPFHPRFWPERLGQAKARKTPSGIFLNDMSDWMGSYWPREWTEMEIETMKQCSQHRFYTLTKQPQNLIKFSPFLENCWVGVTATDAKMAFEADCNLARISANVKFISFEPLLGRIENPEGLLACLTRHIDWIIIGAQTKPCKPPLKIWVDEITEACKKANIPYFLKDNLRSLMGNDLVQDMPIGVEIDR